MDVLPDDIRGRFIAQVMWSELEKIAQGEGPGGLTAAPGQQAEAGKLEGTVAQGPDSEEEASPAHGVVASRIEQLDDKQARGIPVIEPPPGYVYAPELGAFVPNQGDPGWMSPEMAEEASRNKGWFDAGAEKVQTNRAQEEIDGQVQQQAAASVQQQAAEQQQAAGQQVADQKGMEAAAVEQAKQQAILGAAQTPPSIAGVPELQSPGGRRSKGVTIKIGK
jgi:hypothetical protein